MSDELYKDIGDLIPREEDVARPVYEAMIMWRAVARIWGRDATGKIAESVLKPNEKALKAAVAAYEAAAAENRPPAPPPKRVHLPPEIKKGRGA